MGWEGVQGGQGRGGGEGLDWILLYCTALVRGRERGVWEVGSGEGRDEGDEVRGDKGRCYSRVRRSEAIELVG